MRNRLAGFNLIEIAIVLAIVSLLIGAGFKSQEMIINAKVKNLIANFKNIPVYLNEYQGKYKALPGDDKTIGGADSHLPNATPCAPLAVGSCEPGNSLIDGNWNDTTSASESYVFWQHLRLAGLVSGSTTPGDSNYLPVNEVGGTMGIQSGTLDVTKSPINATPGANPIQGTYIICSENIMGKYAKLIDIAMDDGNTATGAMMTGIATPPGTPMVAVANLDDYTLYTVCLGI